MNPKTQKRVHLILAKIRDYMDTRFMHASRVNPKLKAIYPDLRWQQMTTLRLILESSKAYGPDRYIVADILCDENISRKKALFNPTDQNSVMNEIINLKEEEGKTKRAGQLPISDMRTFYSALDPSLERIVELIQIWMWWDLADAADLVAFEHQIQVFQKVMKAPLKGAVMEHYQKALKTPASDITREDILQYEFKKMEVLIEQFQERRNLDQGYQMIIKRDVKDGKFVGEPYDYKEMQLKKLKAVCEKLKPEKKQ